MHVCAWLCVYAQIHLIDTTRTDFARHHYCFLEIKKGCAGKMNRKNDRKKKNEKWWEPKLKYLVQNSNILR